MSPPSTAESFRNSQESAEGCQTQLGSTIPSTNCFCEGPTDFYNENKDLTNLQGHRQARGEPSIMCTNLLCPECQLQCNRESRALSFKNSKPQQLNTSTQHRCPGSTWPCRRLAESKSGQAAKRKWMQTVVAALPAPQEQIKLCG